MSEELKTITIGDDDQPYFSLCPGHVDAATFNKAFSAEGWSSDARADETDIEHEYWTREGDHYKRSTQDDPNAEPFTVSEW